MTHGIVVELMVSFPDVRPPCDPQGAVLPCSAVRDKSPYAAHMIVEPLLLQLTQKFLKEMEMPHIGFRDRPALRPLC